MKDKIKKLLEYIKNNPNIVKICAGVLAAIALLIIINPFRGKNYDGLKIDENGLIIIKEDDKYGYIDKNGKVVIKPTYNQASTFTGNYAIVQKDDKYQLIDKKGKVKFEVDYASKIKYVSDYNIWIIDDVLYNSSLKRISKKGLNVSYEKYGILKWTNEEKKTTGLMNEKGKVIYTYKLKEDTGYISIPSITNDSGSNINDDTRYCIVNTEEKEYGILNCNNGKKIYKFTEDIIENNTGTVYYIKDKESKEIKEKIVIINNKVVYKTDDKDIEINSKNNYYVVNEEKTKYINKSSGKVLKDKPADLDENYDLTSVEKYLGYRKFQDDNKYGIMKENSITVKCEYERIKFFDIITTRYLKSKNKYYALAKKDNKYYLINIKNGKKIEEFNTDSISAYSTSMFITYKDMEKNKKYVYNLVSGKSKEFDSDVVISLHQNYFTIKSDKTEYYNSKFKLIYEN